MGDWAGENWVNVKSSKVRSIMENRIVRAAAAGCHAVDPDNVDGYVSIILEYCSVNVLTICLQNGNQDGYGYPRSAYVDYIKFMAGVAHKNGLAIGLKNGIEMIPDVLSDIQFAVNEECHTYGECARYQPITKAGLAVFNIEYGVKDCSDPANVNLSTVFKTLDLDTTGGQC